MARLYDRILAEGATASRRGREVPIGRGVRSDIERATVVVADNVAEYFFSHSEQEVWGPDDFPCARPPLSPLWVEFRAPGVIRSGTRVTDWARPERSWAWLVSSGDHSKGSSPGEVENTQHPAFIGLGERVTPGALPSTRPTRGTQPPLFGGMVPITVALFIENRRQLIIPEVSLDPEFDAECEQAFGGRLKPGRYRLDQSPMGPVLCERVFVDSCGRLLGDPSVENQYTREVWGATDEPRDEIAIAMQHYDPLLDPLWLAISFMHCRNVVSRAEEQPPKLSKKWERKHGRPLVRYQVLDINPMRKVLRDEGGSEGTGLKRALHICRGHFAYYSNGLFGRGAPETVWRPQHARGSAKSGAVVTDYRVGAP